MWGMWPQLGHDYDHIPTSMLYEEYFNFHNHRAIIFQVMAIVQCIAYPFMLRMTAAHDTIMYVFLVMFSH